MSELGERTAQAKPQTLKVSLQDAMAALLKAIAPSAPVEPATKAVGKAPRGPMPPAVAEPEMSYDIRNAIADVAAPKAAAKLTARTRDEWQTISTAPFDRDVQVGIHVEGGVLPIFFPCRRTATGWTNAIVRAPLFHEPTCWRDWPETTIRVG